MIINHVNLIPKSKFLLILSFTLAILVTGCKGTGTSGGQDAVLIAPESQVFILRDVENNIDIEQVVAREDEFTQANNRFMAGYSNNSVWMKLKFDPSTMNLKEPLYIRFISIAISIEVFYQNKQLAWQSEKTGMMVPFNEWPVKSFGTSFRIDDKLNNGSELYFRFVGAGRLSTSHDVLAISEFTHKDIVDLLVWGCLIGLSFIAACSAMLIFFYTRDASYVYFSFFSITITSWNILMQGLLPHLAPQLSIYFYQIEYLTIAGIGVSTMQFIRHFVGFKSFMPKLDKIFLLFVNLYLLSAVIRLIFIDDARASVFVSLVAFGSGILVLGALLLGSFKGNRESILLTIAWTPGVASAVVSVPTYLGLAPGYWWNIHIVPLALAAAIVLFSFALADKVNLLRKHRNKLLLDQTDELKRKVAEQTQHLTEQTKELSRQGNMLAHTLSYKEDLLANIAHELKTPLTLMLGVLTSSLGMQDKSNRLKRMIQRVNLLLDNMTTLARGNHFQSLERDSKIPYRCHEFVEFYITTYLGFIPKQRLQLTANETAIVACPADTLDKVITNLINNALKYSPSGTGIEVEATINGNNWQFKVTNGGKGIRPEQLNTVFTRYVQLGDNNNSYGLGLGLPLVKTLVEAAGGKIEITSVPDEFTCVKVILPLSEKTPPHEAKGIAEDDKASSENYLSWIQDEIDKSGFLAMPVVEQSHREDKALVYCIDDNHQLLAQLKEQLDHRFNLVCFDNPIDAYSLAVQQIPDLIVSDVMMPQMTGFELIQKIRTETAISHVPVILLTAKSDPQSKQMGLDNLADDYICKPYDANMLASKIDSLINIRKLLHSRFNISGGNDNAEHERQDTATVILSGCLPNERRFMQKVIDFMYENLSNSEFNSQGLSEHLFLSESQMRRKIKAISGYTPLEVLRILRLETAAQWIKRGDNLKTVAHELGFANQSHMGTLFKAYFGVTPKQYLVQLA
jgi:signal transduction histidine kinase/DNA-binding response OmpR family regulator